MMNDELLDVDLCHITTVGRISGRPHRIEIWFAHEARTIYLLSGGGDGSDWVKNILATPQVVVEIGPEDSTGNGRVDLSPVEERRARDLVFAKYRHRYAGDLVEWRDSSLPIAIDLD